jgi:hypothetical protein
MYGESDKHVSKSTKMKTMKEPKLSSTIKEYNESGRGTIKGFSTPTFAKVRTTKR